MLIKVLAINHAVKRNFENCWDVQGAAARRLKAESQARAKAKERLRAQIETRASAERKVKAEAEKMLLTQHLQLSLSKTRQQPIHSE